MKTFFSWPTYYKRTPRPIEGPLPGVARHQLPQRLSALLARLTLSLYSPKRGAKNCTSRGTQKNDPYTIHRRARLRENGLSRLPNASTRAKSYNCLLCRPALSLSPRAFLRNLGAFDLPRAERARALYENRRIIRSALFLPFMGLCTCARARGV